MRLMWLKTWPHCAHRHLAGTVPHVHVHCTCTYRAEVSPASNINGVSGIARLGWDG